MRFIEEPIELTFEMLCELIGSLANEYRNTLTHGEAKRET